ncbi:hypothetical protein [Paraglaciecola sp. 2405UD69-4]|uniref:hypothetical protein n=1 Tax=Paraglaciecola sp. 2405UD69-4 TaxID=3391836 RepID=UPI0039C93829
MSNIDYIMNLCHEIHHKGKTPSVALIRSSAARPLPIPEVIQAIKHWKANPEYKPSLVKFEPEEKPAIELLLEQRVSHLERQLETIMNEIALLKSKFNE